MTTTEKLRTEREETENRTQGRVPGEMMVVYYKKFEILQKETANFTVLTDCVPVISDLITCDLVVDRVLLKSLLRSLVQMVVSSEKVVQKLSAAWKTNMLMRDMLRVMREYVMTQYKHYQLYMHNVIVLMKCLAQVMKKNKAKENEFISTKYLVGKDCCTILDVLLKPMQYLINMNETFNDLGSMLLDNQDTDYIGDIKLYLTRVFNKIQNKLDLMSDIVEKIIKQYEKRCKQKKSTDENWRKIKEKLKHVFQIAIVEPCSFILNLYTNYYFPSEEQIRMYLNNII